jgi:hypothetical protein
MCMTRSNLPFWLGNEEPEHVKKIMVTYESNLSIHNNHHTPESLVQWSETANPPLFIGRIVRHVYQLGYSTMYTLDEIYVYYRDPWTQVGTPFPFAFKRYTHTVWNMLDGLPEQQNCLTRLEFQSMILSTSMDVCYCLYSMPQFVHYANNNYRSIVGARYLIVSYGGLLDRCMQTVFTKRECNRQLLMEEERDAFDEIPLDVVDHDLDVCSMTSDEIDCSMSSSNNCIDLSDMQQIIDPQASRYSRAVSWFVDEEEDDDDDLYISDDSDSEDDEPDNLTENSSENYHHRSCLQFHYPPATTTSNNANVFLCV